MRRFRTKRPVHRLIILLLGVVFLVSGCSHISVPEAQTTFARKPQVAEIPDADETVRGTDDPSIVTLKIGNALRNRRLSAGEPLPENIEIPATNLQSVPVVAALQAVLSQTDIALSYQDRAIEGQTVTVLNLSGSLNKAVDRICAAGRIFCSYRNGSLELQAKDTFIIELPPVERSVSSSSSGSSSTSNSISDAIDELSGGKAQIDQAGGNLIYTTDYEGQYRVNQYLEQLRNGRPMVVLQLYIWEVSLDSENATGINWSNLSFNKIGGGWEALRLASDSALTAVTGGVSLGAVLRGKVDADVVAKFLATQGVVQTISNPQMTFVSGSTAEFNVGGKQRYISQVGQLTSTVSGSSSGSIGNNTVSTDEIDTGLKVAVNGSYESGVIFATMNIKISNLIRIQSVSTGSTQLQLPETSERSLSTVLRVRPGDNLVLAGMTSSRDTLNRDKLPIPFITQIPMQADDQKQNRELVILVKPSIVMFADEEGSKIAVSQNDKVGVSARGSEGIDNSRLATTAKVDGNLIQDGLSSAFHALDQTTPTPDP